MSADLPAPGWTPQAATSWKLSLPCTKAEAEALSGETPVLDALDTPPVITVSEPDPARPEEWQADFYFEGAPAPDDLALVRSLVPSASHISATPAPLVDVDWVTMSQRWLEPLSVGRFHVHTAAHADAIPADAISFHIEASRAFGTGHHETTTGCLQMLDLLEQQGAAYANVADIGTGTGLLAFAARALWPDARYIAADIDPISIDVTRENMVANGIPADAIALAVADGVDLPAVAGRAPFDLLIANILAGPLIELAPSFAKVIAPGATVILAGLLATQEKAVLDVYALSGLDIHHRLQHGDWPILALRKQL